MRGFLDFARNDTVAEEIRAGRKVGVCRAAMTAAKTSKSWVETQREGAVSARPKRKPRRAAGLEELTGWS